MRNECEVSKSHLMHAQAFVADNYLRLWFPILVIKYVYKVNNQVGAAELNKKLKPKVIEK